ncbi:ABC transporter ATP-binding protein [Halalkalibacter sp. APA_J-10(15)]|uniref:ABC transporter ATP-binding protein n=1 Tax=unclassified Halalkalibacter TaxID=2893063 RepID=UPI001FF35BDC|nr:ABC transporter ATP-binding protein [Halalkalibacter sp. APA_J-10(15)]MCK0472423.1 ABC transporter ATP-binding protein/permease [Halalkalibacter sp. APA_J-10(15)]
MLKLFPFLTPYRIPIWIALTLMFVELVVELIHPLLLARIIDDGIVGNDMAFVMRWGGIMIAMSLLAFISGIINSFYAGHVSQSTGYDIRGDMYEKIQRFSYETLQRFQTSSLITRMTNDVTLIQNTIFMCLRIMFRAPLIVFGGVIMALFVNVRLGLILVVTIPIIILFLTWMMKRGSGLFKDVQARLDGLNHVFRENLQAIRMIKVFVTRKVEQSRFSKRNEELKEKTINVMRLMEVAMPLLLLLMNTAIVAIIWFGDMAVVSQNAQVGEVVAILNYAMRITGALSMFSMFVIIFSRTKASAERISQVLEEETEKDVERSQSAKVEKGAITFQHVYFRYPTMKEDVLTDISLTIEAGQTIAFMGETGSGKSSLFQLIPRLFEPQKGSVYIDGNKINQFHSEELRQAIGYVPQEVFLFSGTIKDNLLWGKRNASVEEMTQAVKEAQIAHTIQSLPLKYDTLIGQKGVNLSGGQKQRMSIARALVRKPKILLLDDSTSALDVRTEAKLLNAIRSHSCTTLFITQKITSAMEADLIVLMEDGQIIAKGSHEELFQQSTMYQELVQSQEQKEVLIHE